MLGHYMLKSDNKRHNMFELDNMKTQDAKITLLLQVIYYYITNPPTVKASWAVGYFLQIQILN